MRSLLKELPELVAKNVITSATAQNIEAYYASRKAPDGNNLLTIFGVIGAVLTGLGIILIFAHNWDTFPKSVKTMLALLPLVVFQGHAAYTILTKKDARWTESAGVLLFFAVGAAMALISQIYNIPGNLGSYLCTWTLLCLPLVYILRSNALALLHVVFSTWYVWEHGGADKPWMYILFIAALIPFYFERHKSQPVGGITAFLNLALPVSGAIALAMFLDEAYKFNVAIYMAFFGLLYSISRLPFIRRHSLRANGFAFVSQLGIIVLLMVTSFRIFWEIEPGSSFSFSIDTLPIGISCLALSLYILFGVKDVPKRFDPFVAAIFIFPIIYSIGIIEPVMAAVLINLLVLGLGIFIVREGAIRFNFGTLNFGLVIISVLIICRFFDTDLSFAIRGLLFVVVGAGFFLANYLLIRKKKDHEITQ